MKSGHLISLLLVIVFQACFFETSPKERVISLWHDHPGLPMDEIDRYGNNASKEIQYINQAFPIGFGRYGAMFNGGIEEEYLVCNEHSMWDGYRGLKPEDQSGAVDVPQETLKKAQRLIREGRYANSEAEEYILGNIGGRFFMGNYLPLADIIINTGHDESKVTQYKRELNISNAIGKVSYQIEGTNYTREYFCSYPDQVMVLRYTSDKEPMNLDIRQDALHEIKTIKVFEDRLEISGKGPSTDKKITLRGRGKAVPKGETYEEVTPANERASVAFKQAIEIHSNDGEISTNQESLQIKNATEVVLLVTAATDYLPIYPTFKGNDYVASCNEILEKAIDKTYKNLKKRHKEDYHRLFNRTQLTLDYQTSGLPSDSLLAKGASPELDELFYHYGRYLMIASSRDGAIPSNLQGIWNPVYYPIWDSDYHTDINIQMNYWMTETSNLSECFEPFLNWMKIIRESGTHTARRVLHADGWALQTTTSIFGSTSPRKHFRPSFNLISGAWLSQHLFEHYAFSQDVEYLKEIYPILKESAQFYLDFMIPYKDGSYVLSPTWSAENSFLKEQFGRLNKITEGAAMDQQIMYNLFVDCLEATRILQIDEAFQKELIDRIPKLSPQRIGQYGQLQEWVEDWDDPKDQHRHVSHLWALHPGRDISPLITPELSNAALQSLIFRGGGQTGWSRAWKINFYCRFHKGDQAYEILSGLYDKGVLPNLLDTHPPFQIDGNFGAHAAVNEMLLQSHLRSYTDAKTIEKAVYPSYKGNESKTVFEPRIPPDNLGEAPYILHVLPALPTAWSSGKIKGLKARGGFTVDITWRNGQLIELEIHSTQGKDLRVYLDGKLSPIIQTNKGQSLTMDYEGIMGEI